MPATILRRSDDAVMSRKTSSSAPSSEYRRPHSMGSPASRNPTKLTPLTTRPSLTSRQGMMRLANIRTCFQCVLEFDESLIKGLADDHSVEARFLHLGKRTDIFKFRDAPGC